MKSTQFEANKTEMSAAVLPRSILIRALISQLDFAKFFSLMSTSLVKVPTLYPTRVNTFFNFILGINLLNPTSLDVLKIPA